MVLLWFLLTILFCHVSLFFFLNIDLYFLIAAIIAQIFNSTVELEIPIGIPTKETEIEI